MSLNRLYEDIVQRLDEDERNSTWDAIEVAVERILGHANLDKSDFKKIFIANDVVRAKGRDHDIKQFLRYVILDKDVTDDEIENIAAEVISTNYNELEEYNWKLRKDCGTANVELSIQNADFKTPATSDKRLNYNKFMNHNSNISTLILYQEGVAIGKANIWNRCELDGTPCVYVDGILPASGDIFNMINASVRNKGWVVGRPGDCVYFYGITAQQIPVLDSGKVLKWQDTFTVLNKSKHRLESKACNKKDK